jgi:hypothetical protein
VEIDIFLLLRFSIQEVENLLKVFAISIYLSTFISFTVTSLWGLIWFDGLWLCIHFHIPFNKVEYVDDPNDALKVWYNLFNAILNKHAPIVTKRVKRDKQPAWSLLKFVEADIFSLLIFSIQEVDNLLKVFAISIDLSTFRSFSITSLWGLIWFDGFRLCIHFAIFKSGEKCLL